MNDEGFWDSHHEFPKPAGVKRILFLGDSFTIGYGVKRERRFSDIIKKCLSSEYQVFNMGMWGYGTDQELLILQEKGLKYSPDIVILSMFLDDLFTTHLFSIHKGSYIKPKFSLLKNDILELCNIPVPNNRGKSLLFNVMITRLYILRNCLAVGLEFMRSDWLSIFDKKFLLAERYDLSLRLLYKIHELSKVNDIKFLLVIIPFKDQLDAQRIYSMRRSYYGIPSDRLDLDLPQKVLIPFCEDAGIQVLDLLPVFKRRKKTHKLHFNQDLHWTNEGHYLAAEEILSYLRKLKYI
jgi:hypothetical protein